MLFSFACNRSSHLDSKQIAWKIYDIIFANKYVCVYLYKSVVLLTEINLEHHS